jgi:hypothetical protein
MLLKPRSKGVKYAPSKRKDEHIVVWEWQLDKVRGDHLANRVGINKSGEEDEWNKMLGQNDRL